MNLVFDYQNYREFLKEYYNDQKTKRTGFTYSRFSSMAKLKSPNYLKMIIDGTRNLTPENIIRFSKGLKLTDHESDYFEALVHFNQAKNSLESSYYQDRMNRVRARGTGTCERTLEEYEFESVSNWLHHTLMVMTHLQGFRENATWIRQHIFGLASEEEIRSVLFRLQEAKLLSRDKNGHLRQTHRQVKTKAELRKLSIRIFYEGLLARAIQSLKVSGPEEREFGTYFVGLSPHQVPELKKKVREFMKSLNEWALSNSKPDQIYSLMFCGFPLSSQEERVLSEV
ncbi:MAG: TIGR02147 family protein [Bdellovibrionia bacterium]